MGKKTQKKTDTYVNVRKKRASYAPPKSYEQKRGKKKNKGWVSVYNARKK